MEKSYEPCRLRAMGVSGLRRTFNTVHGISNTDIEQARSSQWWNYSKPVIGKVKSLDLDTNVESDTAFAFPYSIFCVQLVLVQRIEY
jgi:hypothetical protein